MSQRNRVKACRSGMNACKTGLKSRIPRHGSQRFDRAGVARSLRSQCWKSRSASMRASCSSVTSPVG
jgi:hypothetical protein